MAAEKNIYVTQQVNSLQAGPKSIKSEAGY